MEWVLSVVIASLVYLTFGSSAQRPAGLRNAWLGATAVLGVQALAALIQAIDATSGEIRLIFAAISWAILAWIAFSLVSANLPAEAKPAVSAPTPTPGASVPPNPVVAAPPPQPPVPPTAPPPTAPPPAPGSF